MRSKIVSSLIVLIALCLGLGSCLDSDTTNPYQKLVEDVRAIDTYLANNPPDIGDIIVRDASGIRLVITEPGTGVIPPTPENTIQVHYTGMILSNGALSVPFEQTTAGNPYTFTLSEKDAGGADVIAGWKHALYMMTEGTH
ncbi:MAG TPA: FKBP-type peptidyl-prolyl cis-trans isomerase, partial [Cyclobacteriaceae bacterium]|nr:FKBP-type peptidyl-prolyl cis-trans isomerase [Cyclobacteriaceae bacterium]